MSKYTRLEDLKDALDEVLRNTLMNYDARVMLFTFIKGFKILRYRKNAKGWARAWYTLIAGPLFVDGYIRDVRINSTVGKMLFGKFAKFGTLTDTLIRVKESVHYDFNTAVHDEYGFISENKLELAKQICEVLNDYDPGHC